MKLAVISEDESLLALCREIAREFPEVSCIFSPQPDPQETVDLCLWDYGPGLFIPETAKWGAKCFALVSPQDLPTFREVHWYAEAGIVLKPATRAVLRALMAQASACKDQRAQSEADSIRSDRDDILQCLLEANLRLQQYDAERTNFLGRALHDFQAPLTALSGYCGLMTEEKIGFLTEQQKLILSRMHHSVHRLCRMTKAMFHLSVGRHVAMKPVLREGDIRDCAEQALYEVQQLAQEKEIQFDVDLDLSGAPLFIDSGQIEQVLLNLLENACKFSPRSGSIMVRGYPCFCDRRAVNVFVSAESDRRVRQVKAPNVYRIDIVDSGPGVSPEHLALIFEEYVSYSGGQDRSRGGLGLAICRMILNQHQGRIWAENTRSGAVFSFVLPLHLASSVHEPSDVTSDASRTELSTVCV